MSTKIALISDIHGNSIALEAVLKNIEFEVIDHIYCLGDILGVGHESNKVLDLLFSRTNISLVIGNHDQEIINILKGENTSRHFLKSHHEWLAKRIDPIYQEKLLNLPRIITHQYEGKTITFLHYKYDEDFNFYPAEEPSLSNLEASYKNAVGDIICSGHTHQVHFFQSVSNTYINPGAVGIDNGGLIAKYAIIELNDELKISFKEVKYCKEEFKGFLQAFEVLKVPFGEMIINGGCYS